MLSADEIYEQLIKAWGIMPAHQEGVMAIIHTSLTNYEGALADTDALLDVIAKDDRKSLVEFCNNNYPLRKDISNE